MKMRILVVLFLIAACSVATFSQTKKFSFRIFVSTNGDKPLQTSMESYLARELRSLGDADVADTGLLWLSVSVLKLETRGGVSAGWAVSYTLTEKVMCEDLLFFDLVDDGLYIGGQEDLRSRAEKIITDIDTNILNKRRKAKS